MIKNRDLTEKGFTLIEVLIALSIFSVGILAVGGMQISAIRGNDLASDFTEALVLAQSKLDELASVSFLANDLVDTHADGAAGINNDTIGTADHNDTVRKYTRLWNTALISVPPVTPPNNNAIRIKIFVQWQQQGKTRKIDLELLRLQ